MTSLGFENYAEALKIYLSKYREVSFDFLSFLSFVNLTGTINLNNELIGMRPNPQGARTRTDLQAAAMAVQSGAAAVSRAIPRPGGPQATAAANPRMPTTY